MVINNHAFIVTNFHASAHYNAPTTAVEVIEKVKKGVKNPRPIIPTMSVSVLSNNSKSYVPCPPNSREVSYCLLYYLDFI